MTLPTTTQRHDEPMDAMPTTSAAAWRGAPGPWEVASAVARALRIASLVGILVATSACQTPPEELTYLGDLPSWSFETESGRAISSESLQGKPWVANFLFTSCPTSCPPLAEATARLQERLKVWRKAGGPRIVSFTVDPITDTQEVLRTFGRKYGADPTVWTFARADYAATNALVTEGFLQPLLRRDHPPGSPLAAVSDKPTPIDTAHSLRFVLIDGHGRMRALYDKDDASLAKLDHALQWLTEHGEAR